MKWNQRMIGWALLLGGLLSCAPASTSDRAGTDGDKKPDVMTSRYAGTLPCADCGGIRTVLELFEETRNGPPTVYSIQETYVATRDGDRTETRKGEWALLRGTPEDPDAVVFELDPGNAGRSRSFAKVGDQELLMLDREGKRIESTLSYALTRVDAAAVDPVVVSEAEASPPVRLTAGQSLYVRLDSNRTTGYAWSLTSESGGGFTSVGVPRYVEAASSTPAAGGGGIEIWQLKFPKKGRFAPRFEYRRPWESKSAVVKSVTWTVEVR